MPLSHSEEPQGVQSTTINKGGQGVRRRERERERKEKEGEEVKRMRGVTEECVCLFTLNEILHLSKRSRGEEEKERRKSIITGHKVKALTDGWEKSDKRREPYRK